MTFAFIFYIKYIKERRSIRAPFFDDQNRARKPLPAETLYHLERVSQSNACAEKTDLRKAKLQMSEGGKAHLSGPDPESPRAGRTALYPQVQGGDGQGVGQELSGGEGAGGADLLLLLGETAEEGISDSPAILNLWREGL